MWSDLEINNLIKSLEVENEDYKMEYGHSSSAKNAIELIKFLKSKNDLNEFQSACKATDGTTLDLSDYKEHIDTLRQYDRDSVTQELADKQYDKLTEVEKLFKLGYLALGLVGEAGEVAEKLKKLMRLNQLPTEEQKTAIALEVGDVLWYASVLLGYLDMDLETCCNALIQKLQSRKERGVIKGEGDNR